MVSTAEQLVFEAFDDLDISHRCLDESERKFAQVIGCIEDILMDERFLDLHSQFMEDHWENFDYGDENKLIYMDIFKKYTQTIEKYIEEELNKEVKDFSMTELEMELRRRHSDLDGEIFEILGTFSDFLSFKEKFLDYKAAKEGKTADLADNLSVIQFKSVE